MAPSLGSVSIDSNNVITYNAGTAARPATNSFTYTTQRMARGEWTRRPVQITIEDFRASSVDAAGHIVFGFGPPTSANRSSTVPTRIRLVRMNPVEVTLAGVPRPPAFRSVGPP